MINSTLWQPNGFYLACLEGDIQKARATVEFDLLNQADTDDNTPLHIASSKGHVELVELLFRYNANRKLKNKAGFTAEQMAKDDEIRNLFKDRKRPTTDTAHLVSETPDVEWFDNYKNAYRIAYENREHMKRWLLKVPLKKLLNEMDTGYIANMEFPSKKATDYFKDYLKMVVEYEQPKELVKLYSSSGVNFCTRLNYDLAEIGSNFRFLSTQNLFNSGYLDNEAPKGLGQHIFAAILINHPIFRPYYKTGTTYRGMTITPGELAQYKEGDIVLTRSFLSTSQEPNAAKFFLPSNENLNQGISTEGKVPVLCVYKVVNPRSSLYIEELSVFQQEKEALIVPFVVFRVTQIDSARSDENGHMNPVTIHLKECDSNNP